MTAAADTVGEAAAPARGDACAGAMAALIHELAEALTATGIYLQAAARRLDEEFDPSDTRLREFVVKSLTQFSRASEALAELRKAAL